MAGRGSSQINTWSQTIRGLKLQGTMSIVDSVASTTKVPMWRQWILGDVSKTLASTGSGS